MTKERSRNVIENQRDLQIGSHRGFRDEKPGFRCQVSGVRCKLVGWHKKSRAERESVLLKEFEEAFGRIVAGEGPNRRQMRRAKPNEPKRINTLCVNRIAHERHERNPRCLSAIISIAYSNIAPDFEGICMDSARPIADLDRRQHSGTLAAVLGPWGGTLESCLQP